MTEQNKETQLITGLFKENESLLKALRALFFGLPLSQEEKQDIVSKFSEGEANRMMWRRFCPSLERSTPIGQVQDVWLGAEQMVFGMTKDTVKQAIDYKELSINMVKQALGLLKNPEGEAPIVEYSSKEDDELGIKLLARNQYIRHIEQQLSMLHVIANQQQETTRDNKSSAK